MWKKLGVTLIALLSTFSVVYAMNKEMSATTSIYNAGGTVIGRFNRSAGDLGTLPISENFAKGDKILSGLTNPNTNEPISWMLIGYEKDYTDYTQPHHLEDGTVIANPVDPAKSAWFSLANDVIGETIASETAAFNISTPGYLTAELASSKLYEPINDINRKLSQGKGYAMIADRNLTATRAVANGGGLAANYISYQRLLQDSASRGKVSFIGEPEMFPFSYNDMKFSMDYWSVYNNHGASRVYVWNYVEANSGIVYGAPSVKCDSVTKGIRPAIYLDTNTIVFAISSGENANIASVSKYTLPSSYSSLYTTTSTVANLKARVYDASMNVTLQGIYDASDRAITSVQKDGTVYLKGEGNPGNTNGLHTISVAVFNASNEFLYYKPLNTTVSGVYNYAFDTTGIANGNYKIGIVNEAYNESDTAPAISSDMSEVFALKIADQLSFTYTTTPQASMDTYEYSKNVKQGDKIGSLSYVNGAGIPSFTIVADPTAPSGHANDFANFEIGSFTTSPVDVKVKSSGAPDIANGSLKAKDYYFRIEGMDGNGDPVPKPFKTRFEYR